VVGGGGGGGVRHTTADLTEKLSAKTPMQVKPNGSGPAGICFHFVLLTRLSIEPCDVHCVLVGT